MSSSCNSDPQRRSQILRQYNRQLENELLELKLRVNGCGVYDSCDVSFVSPRISISGTTATFTWNSLIGQTFKVDSSPDGVVWTEVYAALPATAETTSFSVDLIDGTDLLSYRIRENTPGGNMCPTTDPCTPCLSIAVADATYLKIVTASTTYQLKSTKLTDFVALADGVGALTNDGAGNLSWTPGSGSGTVTSVSVTTANGVSGSVATDTTTPAITLTLGAITPTSVAASGAVSGSNLSGTNTGDQTTITGNAGSATVLQTARTINGVSFDGSANITVEAAAGTLTGSTLAAGVTASSLTSVGTLATLTVTAPIIGSVTGNSATATALQTARNINGVSFNGSANITVTASADTLTGTTLPALSGVNLTALNGTNIASGTVADARIASTIARLTDLPGVVNNVVTEATTARTLGLSGIGKYIRCTNAGAITITVPTNAVTAIPVGSEFYFRRAIGAGAIGLSFAGVTINNSALVATIAVSGNFCLKKIDTDTWDAI